MSSNWKLLANKSLERNRSLSSKKNSNTKYKPRKQERTPRDSSFISPSIMNSFSRADSSSMIGIQDREEKFSQKQFPQPKAIAEKPPVRPPINNVVKNNTSERKLESKVSCSIRRAQSKQEQALKQLQILKRQFKKFRDQIMIQLQKQEKILEKLVKDTFKNYYEKQSKAQYGVFQKPNSARRETPTFNFPIIEDLKPFVLPKSSQSQICQSKTKFPPKTPKQKPLTMEKSQSEHQRFDRFFEAISKLRNNLQDMSTLSSVDSILSPKNDESKQFTFNKDTKLSH